MSTLSHEHLDAHHTIPKRDTLVLITRVVLGGLFIFAGVMKLQDPQAFAFAIKAFKLFGTSAGDTLIPFLAYATPWIEIAAGLALILGVWGRAAAVLVGAMLVAFIAAVISVIAQGIETKCTCFGKFEWPCVGAVGYCQVVRNLVLLALALPTMWWGAGRWAFTRDAATKLRS